MPLTTSATCPFTVTATGELTACSASVHRIDWHAAIRPATARRGALDLYLGAACSSNHGLGRGSCLLGSGRLLLTCCHMPAFTILRSGILAYRLAHLPW